jgi:uncharacterized protein (TIGR02646 family)
MIQVFPSDLDAATLATLARLQGIVDAEVGHVNQAAKAKSEWGAKLSTNEKKRAFISVKNGLKAMCSGARRCCYCEDAPADEIEHIAPKSVYPSRTFIWDNYLYVCGLCNGPKGDQFAVFRADTGEFVTETKPPIDGRPVLINPRVENPLEYLTLDLKDTFYFHPKGASGTEEHRRGQYTIEVLGLNSRDYLTGARGQAFEEYLALLEKYAKNQALHIQGAILRKNHPTVWQEMQRQRDNHPHLKSLFAMVPAALTWNL